MQKLYIRFLIGASCLSLLIMTGCMSSTRNLNPKDEVHYDASYDFSDKAKIVDGLVTPLLAAPVFPVQEKPIMVIYPVVNETTEHISTSGITDDIRMKLVQSARFRFISEDQRVNIQKETKYQYQGYVDPAMRVEQGRQLGANYIMSGTLRSIKKKEPKQVRLTREERIYYSLNLTITDLKTSEVVYENQVEIARESSKPIIGW
jgi:penicillin-binding protein activator